MPRSSGTAIDDYVSAYPEAQRAALLLMRDRAVKLLPGAEQVLAWGMPALRIDGEAVIAFAGFKRHNSLFPMSGAVIGELGNELSGYVVSKGTIQLPAAEAIPVAVMRRVVEVRIAEINESFPRASGVTKSFYGNGYLRHRGRVTSVDGNVVENSRWEFFRKDGTLMRAGTYKRGVQVGLWETFGRDGMVTKSVDYGR